MLTRLRHINFHKLADAALACGIYGEPVHLYFVAPAGTGKTWAIKSLRSHENVYYYLGSSTPNEYKSTILEVSKSVKLFIHDDVGRINSKYYRDFISIFCDLTEGHTEFRQYKKSVFVDFGFSTIFTSTTDFYYGCRDHLKETGYLDRVLCIKVGLDPNTRDLYQRQLQESADQGRFSTEPSMRKPELLQRHDAHQVYDFNPDPRMMQNLLRLSRYLSREEMEELVRVTRTDRIEYTI